MSEKYFHYTRSIIFFIILRLVNANLDPYVSINYNEPRENRKWKDTYKAKTTIETNGSVRKTDHSNDLYLIIGGSWTCFFGSSGRGFEETQDPHTKI